MKMLFLLIMTVVSAATQANAQSVTERVKTWYHGPSCKFDSIENALPCLQGETKGLGPTDESPIALGELSLTVTKTKIVYKMATGIKIEQSELDLKNFRLMTKQELGKIFKPDMLDKEFGIIPKNGEFPKIMFLTENGKLKEGAMLQGELFDLLSPTALWSPNSVKLGAFAAQVADIEKRGGKFPKLKYNGKVQ